MNMQGWIAPSYVTMICGGIGSGKSVVSRILSEMGYPVYDCDRRARQIMDSDPDIHSRLCSLIHPKAVRDGIIDRELIGDIVFKDSEKLKALNSIVHSAVLSDIRNWIDSLPAARHAFVECAIPRSSRLDEYITNIWEVVAPLEVRVDRVMLRNCLSRRDVLHRIESQHSEDISGIPHVNIINDNFRPLLPQIQSLLSD